MSASVMSIQIEAAERIEELEREGQVLPTPKRLRIGPSHRRSKAQERESAERFGGHVTRGSGSGREKADVRVRGIVRIESKTTKHRSFSVTTAMIDKLEAGTFGSGEVPVIEVELELGRRRVFVVPDWAMDQMVDAIKQH